jgi:hypothetical protein
LSNVPAGLGDCICAWLGDSVGVRLGLWDWLWLGDWDVVWVSAARPTSPCGCSGVRDVWSSLELAKHNVSSMQRSKHKQNKCTRCNTRPQ